jgi:EAL domain-containing protein (putative c-di-GMP-specific phosphodiesterase class I)
MAGFVDDEFDEDYAEAITRQFNNHGDVHTDSVSFTIIEKENLVRIIEQTVVHEKAIELVDAYLTEHKDNVLEINVAPGTYYCYSMGDHEKLAEHIDEYEHPFAGIDCPVFVFSNRELELANDLAAGPTTM